MRVAAEQARSLRKNALQRQLRFLTKLIAANEPEALAAALDTLQHAHDVNTRAFKELETWRDQLIAGDNQLLTRILDQFREADVQHIEQLIRNAQKERERSGHHVQRVFYFAILRGSRREVAPHTVEDCCMSRVAGKVALVTGAGTGIGRATATRLHEKAPKVFVTDIDASAAQATAEALGDGAASAAQDVRDELQWQTVMSRCTPLLGSWISG